MLGSPRAWQSLDQITHRHLWTHTGRPAATQIDLCANINLHMFRQNLEYTIMQISALIPVHALTHMHGLCARTHAHTIRHELPGVQISTSMPRWICKTGLVWLDGSLVATLHQPLHQPVHLSARPSVRAEMKCSGLPSWALADRLASLPFTAGKQYCSTATCNTAVPQHHSGSHLMSNQV